MRSKRFVDLWLMSILIFAGTARAQEKQPVTVSPGEANSVSVILQSCPTFSWGAVEGAVSYEVVVYELSAEASPQGEEVSPVFPPEPYSCLQKQGCPPTINRQTSLTAWRPSFRHTYSSEILAEKSPL